MSEYAILIIQSIDDRDVYRWVFTEYWPHVDDVLRSLLGCLMSDNPIPIQNVSNEVADGDFIPLVALPPSDTLDEIFSHENFSFVNNKATFVMREGSKVELYVLAFSGVVWNRQRKEGDNFWILAKNNTNRFAQRRVIEYPSFWNRFWKFLGYSPRPRGFATVEDAVRFAVTLDERKIF